MLNVVAKISHEPLGNTAGLVSVLCTCLSKMMATKRLFELCEQSFETRQETVLGLRFCTVESEME